MLQLHLGPVGVGVEVPARAERGEAASGQRLGLVGRRGCHLVHSSLEYPVTNVTPAHPAGPGHGLTALPLWLPAESSRPGPNRSGLGLGLSSG